MKFITPLKKFEIAMFGNFIFLGKDFNTLT